jgi:hypothetical protein
MCEKLLKAQRFRKKWLNHKFYKARFSILRDDRGKIIPWYTGRRIYECWMDLDDRDNLIDIVNDNYANHNMNKDEYHAFSSMDILQMHLEGEPRFHYWPYNKEVCDVGCIT